MPQNFPNFAGEKSFFEDFINFMQSFVKKGIRGKMRHSNFSIMEFTKFCYFCLEYLSVSFHCMLLLQICAYLIIESFHKHFELVS